MERTSARSRIDHYDDDENESLPSQTYGQWFRLVSPESGIEGRLSLNEYLPNGIYTIHKFIFSREFVNKVYHVF